MKRLFISALAMFMAFAAFSQNENLWQDATENTFAKKDVRRQIVPDKYRTLSLDVAALEKILAKAPMRFSETAKTSAPVLPIPFPEGKIQNFKLVEAPVMHPELAAKYPYIRSYAGWSEDDPTAYLRCGVTQNGFHAVVFSVRHNTIFIDAYAKGDTEHYISYFKKDFKKDDPFACLAKASQGKELPSQKEAPVAKMTGDCQLRTYALALACTGEYAQYHGGTKPLVMAAYNVAMTRINGIYEKDNTVTMIMVPNTDQLIFLNAATDPYTNNNGGTMLGQNQTTCDNIIGNANYDIGHVFSTGGGGVASLYAVCSTSSKARGVTGQGNPVGDPFYVDYVAHEMGHQFGANHTQNNSCGRNNATAMEPGSASTIMGYAGICSPNVQNNSDDYFHAISLDEIAAHVTGFGNSCATTTTTGNNAPSVTLPSAFYSVPVSTPLALTATGSDPDGNTLTYCWEQMDNQIATMPPQSTNTGGPAFRSLNPVESPTRYLPGINAVINGTMPTWEVLPSVSRTMNFRCTVRDNFPGAGCTDEADVTLSFTASAGPFVVTNPTAGGIVWYVGEPQTVTWDVANTNNAPVNVSQVEILLSTDGGLTYPVTLSGGTGNDGAATITVPNNITNTARVMVKGKGNVFFDISNQNFSIQEPPVPTFTLLADPASVAACKDELAEYALNMFPLAGFNEALSFTVSGLPQDAAATFTPPTLTPPGTVVMSVGNLENATAGSYTLTISAAGLSMSKDVDVELIVLDSLTSGAALSAPANGTTGVAFGPSPLTWQPVASATSYAVEVAENPSFQTLFHTGTTGGTSYGVPGTVTGQVYYWRVKGLNNCNEGPFSEAFAFQTSGIACETYVSTNVPVTIPDNAAVTVFDSIEIPDSLAVISVNAHLDISHTWIGDLAATLYSPQGTAVTLFDQPGVPASTFGCDGDDIIANFFDTAPNTAGVFENTCGGVPPAISGDFQPVTPLAAFFNENSDGVWTLELADAFAEDGGTINQFQLEVCGGVPFAAPMLLANNTLTVPQGQNATVTTGHLQSDGDSPIVFTLVGLPANGVLLLLSDTLNPGDTFTQADIAAGSLSYQHDGSATTADDFHFDVLTGGNGWLHDQVFNIEILQNTLAATAALTQAIACHNDDDAIITVTATGGTAPIEYSLNGGPFQSNNVFENLAEGSYAVEVKDANGFTFTTNTLTVTNPAVLSVSAAVIDDDITVTATGGTGALQYSLDGTNYQSSNQFPDLPNGSYTIWVVDENGCTATTSAIVAVNTMVASASVTQAISCAGANNGEITTSVGGGTPPYQYSLNSGAFQSSPVFGNLPAGTYTVTVIDSDGFTATGNIVTLSDPAALSGNVSVNGYTVTVNAGGGTGALQYSLDGGAFQPGNTFFPVANGSHTIAVKDANGCQITIPVTVNVAALSVSAAITQNILCFGEANGEITATGGGGVPPYTYSLDGGPFQAGAVFSNLPAGTYTVTVKDSGGFTSSDSPVTVTEPAQLTAASSVAGAEITIAAGGGTPPYLYSLDGGPFQASNVFTAGANGTFEITVQDANGCEVVVEQAVNVPAPEITEVQITELACHNDTDGGLTVIGNCGMEPCLYSIDGVNYQSANVFENLPAGPFILTMMDGFGSVSTATFVTIQNPAELMVSASAFGLTISVAASGGTGALQYSFDGGPFQPENQFDVIFNGTYAVVVMDENGCTTETEVVVNAPDAVLFNVTNVSCVDSLDGLIVIEGVNGGYPPYQFSVNNGPFTSNLIYSNLGFGEYIFVVQDSTGFQFEADTVFIDDPFPIEAGIETEGSTLTIAATGGTGVLLYSIDGGTTFQQGNVFTDLPNGDYDIVVMDENGCTWSGTATILIDSVTDVTGQLAFLLSPNPSAGVFKIKLDLPAPAELQLAVYDVAGKLVFRSEPEVGGQFEQWLDLSFLANGSYQIRVVTGEKWGVKRVVIAR
jgi:subtilisin-like proprotein convertase family protein